jgi:hypothetical protein
MTHLDAPVGRDAREQVAPFSVKLVTDQSIRLGDAPMSLPFILTPQEFWAALIALSCVGLTYFGQDAIRDENSDDRKVWRWGDKYRRPTPQSTWGTHLNCACLSIFVSIVAIDLLL